MISMASQKKVITISDIDVKVIRKDIKNLHLSVHPPEGEVRAAVPEHITDDNVRLAIINKLGWIKRQQKDFKNQPRQSERKYISGECHYFMGKSYRLELIEGVGKQDIKILKSGKLKMFVKPGASISAKEKLLNSWYRKELKKVIPQLLQKWEPVIGEKVNDWTVRKMKTKWGSCNIEKRKISLNLELAKKPQECLEYIVVHEMIHLLERNHNERFKGFMEKYLPKWRARRKLLRDAPLCNWKEVNSILTL